MRISDWSSDVCSSDLLDEVRALERALEKQDAVVGHDADRVAVQVGETGDQGLAVACLELVELAAVDHARDDLADVERAPGVLRHAAVPLARRVQRLARPAHGKPTGLAARSASPPT